MASPAMKFRMNQPPLKLSRSKGLNRVNTCAVSIRVRLLAAAPLPLIALTEALNMAKRRIKRDGEELGLIMGMARGPQETTYKYLQSLKPDPGKVRTSEFPGSLMNAIATFAVFLKGKRLHHYSCNR